MAAKKFSISVPEEVMVEVDAAADRLGMTRSRFVAVVLSHVARARSDAEVTRRVNRLFAEPDIAREQLETAATLRTAAHQAGTEW